MFRLPGPFPTAAPHLQPNPGPGILPTSEAPGQIQRVQGQGMPVWQEVRRPQAEGGEVIRVGGQRVWSCRGKGLLCCLSRAWEPSGHERSLPGLLPYPEPHRFPQFNKGRQGPLACPLPGTRPSSRLGTLAPIALRPCPISLCFLYLFFFGGSICLFRGLHLWHMEVRRLGVQSEL